MHGEITFFIRAFFFVFMGIIVVIDSTLVLYGLAITAVLIVLRIIAVRISTIGMDIVAHEQTIMAVMVPRGLAAAILAQLLVSFGVPNAEAFVSIVFVVILASVIYTTIGALASSRKHTEEKSHKKHSLEREMDEERKAAKKSRRKKSRKKTKGLVTPFS